MGGMRRPQRVPQSPEALLPRAPPRAPNKAASHSSPPPPGAGGVVVVSGPLRAHWDPRLRLAGQRPIATFPRRRQRPISGSPAVTVAAASQASDDWSARTELRADWRRRRTLETFKRGAGGGAGPDGTRRSRRTGERPAPHRDRAAAPESPLHRLFAPRSPARKVRTAARYRESPIQVRAAAGGRERRPLRRRPGVGAASRAREPPGSVA